ncbi:unnamed protein product [Pleuronectes platessa]|uniref:Uncharacterized protein n=1 Tax=Pleuronectes platessa TaxID=8262 RepID=A0A9N7VK24_PLEPL|nr:unnamed protein product [Pleuronectes platessa]
MTVYQPKLTVCQHSTTLPLSVSNQMLKHLKCSNPRKDLSTITFPQIGKQTATTPPRCSQNTYVKTLTCRIYCHLGFLQQSNNSTVIFSGHCPTHHNLKGNPSLPFTDHVVSLLQVNSSSNLLNPTTNIISTLTT